MYLLATLLPDWQPPAPDSRKAILGHMVPALREAEVNGKSLRELANEVGISHETIRSALKRV